MFTYSLCCYMCISVVLLLNNAIMSERHISVTNRWCKRSDGQWYSYLQLEMVEYTAANGLAVINRDNMVHARQKFVYTYYAFFFP